MLAANAGDSMIQDSLSGQFSTASGNSTGSQTSPETMVITFHEPTGAVPAQPVGAGCSPWADGGRLGIWGAVQGELAASAPAPAGRAPSPRDREGALRPTALSPQSQGRPPRPPLGSGAGGQVAACLRRHKHAWESRWNLF